jgi:hypothetical protein
MTTATTSSSTLFRSLISAGIPIQNAEILDRAFSQEPDFMDGLEMVATVIALKQPPSMVPPNGEPWKHIYEFVFNEIQTGTDIDTAYSESLRQYGPDIILSITAAVSLRMKAILDFEAQKGNKKRFKTKDYIVGLKQLGYTFRLNECGDYIEVNSDKITDGLQAKIRCQMRDAGFVHTLEMEDAYYAQSYQHRYHPVKDFLAGLTWDGDPHIEQLTSYFTDSHNMFHVWLRKWLIGSCARVFEAEQNPMLVLDGAQGIGKSKFVKWLAKPLPEYFLEAPINPDDKDTAIRMISYWIWEVSELGATTRKADYEALKAFLTTRKVVVRKPYGRQDISKPVLASFIGTINNSSGIFSDPTGNRRFLVSHIDEIDWNYSTMINPKDIWAEAMVAYLSHESWILTPQEVKRRQEINELYDVSNPIEDIILKYFTLDPTNTSVWMATSDILHILEDPYQGALKGQTRANAMALSSAMAKLGMERCKRRNPNGQLVWGYVGISIPLTP